MSIVASWFLEEYADLDLRYKISKSLCCEDKGEFLFACKHGMTKLVENLLESGSKKVLNKVNEHGSTGLHLACGFNRLEVVKILVKQLEHMQMNINVRDKSGTIPLVRGIRYEELTKELLQTGKIDTKNIDFGQMSLGWAIKYKELQERAKEILETGNVDIQNLEGVQNYAEHHDGSIFFKIGFGYVVEMKSSTVVRSMETFEEYSDRMEFLKRRSYMPK